jgi:hypothetical protein
LAVNKDTRENGNPVTKLEKYNFNGNARYVRITLNTSLKSLEQKNLYSTTGIQICGVPNDENETDYLSLGV